MLASKTRSADQPAGLYAAFSDPLSQAPLKATPAGLVNDAGITYRFADGNSRVVDFVEPLMATAFDEANLQMYNSKHSTEIYRNFLSWMFATFDEDETTFRRNMLKHLRLSPGMKVLVTGCGLGDDVTIIRELVGPSGEIHAQDLSKAMVLEASKLVPEDNICFSVSNALALPYRSRYFDAVFHFGGINLFGDVKKAICELERVCRIGGRVLFGDEGVAPHLRGSQYSEIAIRNNHLWAAEAPMQLLPHNALDIELTYVLGNCFYLIAFSPSEGYPKMNIDLPHKGIRGGTARTRYFGQLEGVTEKTKEKVIARARELGVSVHSLLEDLINSGIGKKG